MQKRDWLLVYLSLPSNDKEVLIDPIRIMKGLFLFKMEVKDEMELKDDLGDFYEFTPYLYGPYSLEIYDDLFKLQSEGLVDESTQSSSRWSYYRLTKKGCEAAESLKIGAQSELLEKLEELKIKVTSLSFLDLLKEVYKEYPEYAEKSVITI